MSQENVQVVRGTYEAYARADFETALSCLDPEIEFSQPAGEPGAGIYRGRGKGSGVDVEHEIFQVWTLRGGKVVRASMYYDKAEALEAVGLPE